MTQIAQIDAKLYQALSAHTDTFVGAAVHYSPDIPDQPTSDAPYIIVDDVRLQFETRFVGQSEADEYRGTWALSVMVPMAWTGAQAKGLASLVADHFVKGARYTANGATVQIMRRPRIVGAGYQDMGMIRVPVLVEWGAVECLSGSVWRYHDTICRVYYASNQCMFPILLQIHAILTKE